MENVSIFDATEEKRKVNKNQKAWKYIRELCGLNGRALNRTAIIDGDKKYTYGRMFREWERYAAVFTKLGMTEENHARVGVLGSTCAEVTFSFYGLNMVGAQVSLVASWSAFNFERIEETIRQEKLTDFIITDDLAQPDLVRELMLKRKELGINNVILLHVTIKGATSIQVLTTMQEAKFASMKALVRPICMETLLSSYGGRQVRYALQETDENALIMHTTGTTSGTGKPVPMSDLAMNEAVASFMMIRNLSLPYDNLVTATMLDLSNSYGIIDQVHLPFAMGATLVTIPLGFLNTWFYKAISAYHISFLFSASYMLERWMKLPEDTDFDFSSLKFVALGGTAVSAAEKRRFHEFLSSHGGDNVIILNGYGLSEMAGACCLSTPDLDDESIGYPMPGITIRLYDEDKEQFFAPEGKGGEGVLYLTAPCMAGSTLDGKEVIKVEIIDDKPYVCTNDFVRMDPDGRIHYLGRANRFFMRDAGRRKYESGKVETEFSRLREIESCAIVPVYYKIQHDTIPMLCIKLRDGADDPLDVVRNALCKVFIEKKKLPEDDIPSRVMLAKDLPRNSNGKIDLYKLNKGEVSGDVYNVEQVRSEDQLSDFTLSLCQDETGDIVEQVLDSISADIKNNTPGKKIIREIKNKTPKGKNNMLYKNFRSQWDMNRKMMENMQSMMEQWFPWANQFESFKKSPELQSLLEIMPDIEEKMFGMKNRAFPGMMPPMPLMMPGMFQGMMPMFHERSAQWFSYMDQLAFDTLHNVIEMNRLFGDKMFDAVVKMATPQPATFGDDDDDDIVDVDAEELD